MSNYLAQLMKKALEENKKDPVEDVLSKGYKKEIGDLVPGGMSESLSNLPLRKALEKIAEMHSVDIEKIIEEFEIGVPEEMEHTKSILIATEIALDHLVEHHDYYTRLEDAGL